ncbi:bifunctional methylenetetrahydrofolate dehydrogenase/methenyltetrahydrofolate cyclohydrolase FolD [Microbacterium sp. APC 3898]|uniref:Bifunctional protein FolD n=2 Tax=Planococcus TaxID=1372 RepID=A0ABT7ZJC6_9BACL|nr:MULTISPECIES: bifunctional methylenetetrahydrofolate dehydrogenase/methenyltetrahydrofolate cyclohydrolase FolD [Terrabacteria group]MBD8015673.1 bifunctional methylenetetrahydrofolate dehydrogenase/methenyltetrahydrofolate cyclohydrolase FolD [Planococcus wigleyi]MDN3426792.1 bifunctional methylenetetrahydrofolate dehydrogenase/methenyltetrahydrofolate cyclohydrolase FolD [Planococcus sp. APC 4016]MDN3500302.1 bifunctional methylenetetrahydrofolate dehydrogenase/methenyltetrahydrofolate cycl
MAAKLIDGKAVSQKIKMQVKTRVEKLAQQGIVPGLAVVLVGEDSASLTYVKNKKKTCEALGMRSDLHQFPDTLTEQELLAKIDELNSDPGIHGILVQLPLPQQIDEFKVITAISPEKDVDGFHPISVGNMMIGKDAFLPCTPHGIMELLAHYGIDPAGKHAVVIGRSNIVGKPIGQLLLQKDATVTYCHSKTKDLANFTAQADILIAAIGRAKFIDRTFIKPGAVIIDVGMNRDENGKLCGDVDFEDVQETASFVTPVPGGVGPMTIAMLMENTLESAEKGLAKTKQA